MTEIYIPLPTKAHINWQKVWNVQKTWVLCCTDYRCNHNLKILRNHRHEKRMGEKTWISPCVLVKWCALSGLLCKRRTVNISASIRRRSAVGWFRPPGHVPRDKKPESHTADDWSERLHWQWNNQWNFGGPSKHAAEMGFSRNSSFWYDYEVAYQLSMQ